MKKLGLVSALSLGLFLLAGCNTPSNQVTINTSDDMISMYNDTNAITCYLDYSDGKEEGTSTMYIKDGMISQETKLSAAGEESVMYTIARDGKMYVWGNDYGEGVGMSVTYDVDINEEFKGFDEIDENTTVKCSKGVKNNSVFELPTDIEFTSMDDLFNFGGDEYYDDAEIEYDVENNDEVVEEENSEEEVKTPEAQDNNVSEEEIIAEEE